MINKKAVLLLLIFLPLIVAADDMPVQIVQGGTVVPYDHGTIQLKEETIHIYLTDERYTVEVAYTFVNTGGRQQVIMGFPNRMRIDTEYPEFYSNPIEDFKAFEGSRELPIFRKEKERPAFENKSEEEEFEHHERLYGKEVYECFETIFNPGETKSIKNTYSQAMDGHASYILTTGALWKDQIDSIRAFIHLDKLSRQSLTPSECYYLYEEVWDVVGFKLEISPEPKTIENNVAVLEFTSIEPDFDIKVSLAPWVIKAVIASSTLEHKAGLYAAENLYDVNPATAWVEGVKGDGIGEGVQLQLSFPSDYGEESFYLVDGISVVNGYAKNSDLFLKNNRVKKLKIQCSLESPGVERGREETANLLVMIDSLQRNMGRGFGYSFHGEETTFEVQLKDTMEMQYLRFREPVLAGYVTLTILEVYKGSAYDDTCIAEVGILLVE